MTDSSDLIGPARAIDIRAASDDDYARLTALSTLMQRERNPDDPPVPPEEEIANWQAAPDFLVLNAWAVPDAAGEAFVAFALTYSTTMAENAHLMDMQIAVLPEFRRRGIGRHLLEHVVAMAETSEKRLLTASTNDRVPAGAAFMERIGATRGLVSHINQLKLGELNRDLVRHWLERAESTSHDFDLGLWEGPYPDADLSAIAGLFEVMNEQPHDDIEIEDWHITPEMVRQMEAGGLAGDKQRWTLYVRERASGDFAGFTEVIWSPSRPTILEQGATGVYPRFRNRGLGGWLKAAMLEKVERELPQVAIIRTSNADSNAAMLRINTQLGFKPYQTSVTWQVEVVEARMALSRR